MSTEFLLFTLVINITIISFFAAKKKAINYKKKHGGTLDGSMYSLPRYFGYYTAIWAGIPALFLLIIWQYMHGTLIDMSVVDLIPESLKNEDIGLVINQAKTDVTNSVNNETTAFLKKHQEVDNIIHWIKCVSVIAVSITGATLAFLKLKPQSKARGHVESWIKNILLASSLIAVITTLGIVLSLIFESWAFFSYDDGSYKVSAVDFFFGTSWSPNSASPKFGVIPLLIGTLLISALALIVAVPIGLISAIYLSEYASKRARSILKPVLELLAGIPTVVYGFFAVLVIAPLLRGIGDFIDWRTDPASALISSESALAAGLVMGIMLIPFIASLADDAINAVPQYLRDGSYGLGATQSETVKKVILPAALPGIVGGVLLAASRAIGETMIVVMAAGMAASMNVNPFQAVTTITVQIVSALTGDFEFTSPKTLVAFALALLLFFLTLILNLVALRIVKKYREQYD